MKVGVGIARSLPASRERCARVVKRIEELGYWSVIMGEHVVCPKELKSPYPYSPDGSVHWEYTNDWPHAMITLGYIASQTEQIRIGTSAIPIISHDPLSLAKQAATVDVLSGGRLELGLGAGWCLEEAELLGHPSDHPNGRLKETIEIMRLAWGESQFEYHGRFYDFDAVGVHPQPIQGRDLPIWIGGASPRLIRMSAELANGNLVTARRVRDRLDSIREQLPDIQLAAILTLDSEQDAAAYAHEIKDAGADVLYIGGNEDEAQTLEQLEWFAETVMPGLRD